MSRAHRVQVRESVRTTIRAEDHVGTTLELLEILPKEEMAELLRCELEGRGFVLEGNRLVRREGALSIAVDPETGAVEVRAELAEEVEVEGQRQGYGDEDRGRGGRKAIEKSLRDALRKDLEAQAGRHGGDVQRKVTDLLEGALQDLRGELDGVANRVTAEALKQKAARLGRIKEMTEDPEAGSLTIVLEV